MFLVYIRIFWSILCFEVKFLDMKIAFRSNVESNFSLILYFLAHKFGIAVEN